MVRKAAIMALLTSTVGIGHEWKMDGDNFAKDDAGNPIWVNGTQELSVKGDTIASLQGEARRHRTRAEELAGKLSKFDGIEDPDAAKQALETVSKLDAKQLIDSGQVDQVRQQITQQYENKIAEANKKAEAAERRADETLLNSAFASSEFARNRLAVPVEMVRATFNSRFKVEDGQIRAYDEHGQIVLSDKVMGQPADFDEGLEKIVTSYKHKDSILKAPEAGGTGGGGGGGSRGRPRQISRSEFDALNPAEKAEFAGKMRTGEAALTD